MTPPKASLLSEHSYPLARLLCTCHSMHPTTPMREPLASIHAPCFTITTRSDDMRCSDIFFKYFFIYILCSFCSVKTKFIPVEHHLPSLTDLGNMMITVVLYSANQRSQYFIRTWLPLKHTQHSGPYLNLSQMLNQKSFLRRYCPGPDWQGNQGIKAEKCLLIIVKLRGCAIVIFLVAAAVPRTCLLVQSALWLITSSTEEHITLRTVLSLICQRWFKSAVATFR